MKVLQEVFETFPIEMKEAFNDTVQYNNFLQFLKSQILEPNDYQEMRDKKTKKIVNVFLKKSGYYKLKKHFKVKIELVDWKYEVNERGNIKWVIFHVKGHLGNESMDAFGACDSTERGKKGTNDIIGTAHTRANLRAISQLVDFGSVSADEIATLEDKE